MELQSRTLVALTAVLTVGFTLAWEAAPWPPTTYAPEAHLGLEVAAGLIALLVAVMLWGRVRQEQRWRDLALAAALSMLAGSHLAYSALVPALNGGQATGGSAAAAMLGNLLAGVVFFAALPCSDRRVDVRTARRVMAGAVVALGAAGLVALLLAAPGPPSVARGGLGSALHVIGVLAFTVAAIVAARRADEGGDRLMRWLAISAILAAGARLNFALHPTLYTSYVGPGDGLRVLTHLALLVGAAEEMARYWRSLASRAVADERARIARDLHDTMAQDLAFIARRAPDEELSDAARRALADTRNTIAGLRGAASPFGTALTEAVQRTARMAETEAVVTVPPDLTLDADDAEALIRIACEAVLNAGRHGRAGLVRVDVSGGEVLQLRVADDGHGFPARAASGRFGVVGMRERAERAGGRLRLDSEPGVGSVIEVTLP